MVLVDYASNFWGDKHIGYSVLYENMKKGEESVHELLIFLKERINIEEDLFKSIGKSLHRVNGYISNNSGFVEAWKLAKGTLELWTEIQASMLRNLNELLKEVAYYQEELARMRKRAKDVDTLETINLMQTTTTCLQKARDTYNQRSSEVVSLKQNNREWTPASTKEYLKARSKLNKAHEEYKQYMDKYNQIRDIFEERISQAARSFQEHDRLHLLQMKRFFVQMAKCLENGHGANAQVSATLRQNVEQKVQVEDIMLRFIEEKGTGTEPPQKLQWTEADELPLDLDIAPCVPSQSSSSNSSAIVSNFVSHQSQPNINQLLGMNDSWLTVGEESVVSGGGEQSTNSGGSIDGGFGENANTLALKRGSVNGSSEQNKSGGESDSERHLEMSFSVPSANVPSVAPSVPATSYVPQQISAWLGRQKFSGRLKKHFSASQSNLAVPLEEISSTTDGTHQTKPEIVGPALHFSKSYNDPPLKTNRSSGLLKRYQKGKAADGRSMGDLTTIDKLQPELATMVSLDAPKIEKEVRDPLEVFGPPPPLPTTEPPALDNEFGRNSSREHDVDTLSRTKGQKQQQIRQHSVSFVSTASEGTAEDEHQHQRLASSSSSSSSDDEETCLAAQRSKIKQLQIRPLNNSQQSKLNASVDELRTAIGQISLSKCKENKNDPWRRDPNPTAPLKTSVFFSNSHQDGPIRAALTGDEHLRRKYKELPFSDFSQSVTLLSSDPIARARPRSHTPLVPNPFGTPCSSAPFVPIEPKLEAISTAPILSQSAHSSLTDQAVHSGLFSHHSLRNPTHLVDDGLFSQHFSSPSSSAPMSSNPSSSSFSGINCKTTVPGTIPIAMAINEYLHVWIKSDNHTRPEVRLFGSVMFSLRADSLAQLQPIDFEMGPLRFSLIGAEKLNVIGYNKMFLDGPNPSVPHHFAVERQKLADFLRERVNSCAHASFFNDELLRYEISPELAPSPLPLLFTARWIRSDKLAFSSDITVELRIDYHWSKIMENTVAQNVVFNTKVTTQKESSNRGEVSLLSSEPPAKWISEHNMLNWELREVTSNSGGTLKAIFKCAGEPVQANTHAQFQFLETSLSGVQINLDESSGFILSVFRKKLLSGKYFCEPSN